MVSADFLMLVLHTSATAFHSIPQTQQNGLYCGRLYRVPANLRHAQTVSGHAEGEDDGVFATAGGTSKFHLYSKCPVPTAATAAQVEESGIITLNKFFEDKNGIMTPAGVFAYVDPGQECLPALNVLAMRKQVAHAGWDDVYACEQRAPACVPCRVLPWPFQSHPALYPATPAGPLEDKPVMIVHENFIKDWAVRRYRWVGWGCPGAR